MKILLSPDVRLYPALNPRAVLEFPVTLDQRAAYPFAVF
jgi:hypothetical protein